jgi:hypothetical protein
MSEIEDNWTPFRMGGGRDEVVDFHISRENSLGQITAIRSENSISSISKSPHSAVKIHNSPRAPKTIANPRVFFQPPAPTELSINLRHTTDWHTKKKFINKQSDEKKNSRILSSAKLTKSDSSNRHSSGGARAIETNLNAKIFAILWH